MDGKDTAAWAIAAGMKDFDTFRSRCEDDIGGSSFEWPDGIAEVSYGFGDPIKRPDASNAADNLPDP